MTEELAGADPLVHAPSAFFMGDFNVGKSMLINALLRRDTLYSSNEESRALPTFIGRSGILSLTSVNPLPCSL